jgi:hypothetical protein
MGPNLQHKLNPLHVYCRLNDILIFFFVPRRKANRICRSLCKTYETFYRFINDPFSKIKPFFTTLI